jgi:predicted transcriptional regulator
MVILDEEERNTSFAPEREDIVASPYAENINDIKDNVAELRHGQEELTKTQSALMASQARVETLVASLHETCPHRELIARAGNNIKRVEKLEADTRTLQQTLERDMKEIMNAVHKNRLTIAKVVAIVIAGGIVSGGIGAGLIEQLIGLIN